jgi:hypothetical protein
MPRQATPEERAVVKKMRKKRRLSSVALAQLQFCRAPLDPTPVGTQTRLTSVVEGGYANATY